LVVSRVGWDFPSEFIERLRVEGVDLSGITKVPNERNTSFELTYQRDFVSRTLRLRSKGSPIRLRDVPASMKAKVIHVGPIAAELTYEVVEELRSHADCLSIDPQGMTRLFDSDGNVVCSAEMDKRILPLVDVYKSSVEEAKMLTGASDLGKIVKTLHDFGPKTVIVTDGAKGSFLSAEGEICYIPACVPERVVDPTGAGDVFIGAFLVENIKKKDLRWCACVGSAASSFVVEDVGTTSFGKRDEIYRRARIVYENR
jgi:sugar/nucleoside kinase (ribokinase family)